MKTSTLHPVVSADISCGSPRKGSTAERGVVLIVALILLVVISLLAVTSLRNASSTENVLSNVRTTELASQAAEIALRHCELSVEKIQDTAAGRTSTFAYGYTTTFAASDILPTSTTPKWQSLTIWDSTSTATFVLPLGLVNQTGTTATFKRAPECMVEPVPVVLSGGTTANVTSSFVITARGFGPEVPAADASRSKPDGSEVWLQSNIKF
jgi:type IV pilus assembly protein PilX